MSTSIEVPADLRPVLLKDTRADLINLGDNLMHASDDDALAQAVAEIYRLHEAYRALSEDADAYPSDAVRTAAECTIRDSSWLVTDNQITIDEAERLIRRVRACEALAGAEEVTA